MDELNIKIFNHDSSEICMPNKDIKQDESLTQDNFGEAISGDVVQRVLVTIKNKLAPSNYVLDFSNVGAITIFQKEALRSLVYKKKKATLKELEFGTQEEPELITLYMARSGKDLTELGKGEKYFLEKALPLLRTCVFGDEIVIFKDLDSNGQHIEVISDEKVSYRLNI